ncbi:MAG: biliverdin-producing heme oxygenase, partial [Proteobacteria bacterium]
AYVVEGSALGGRFIFKNIEAALGFTDEHGARYFAGYGNKTGSHWKGFLNAFTSYIIENNAQDDAIAGANFAFSRIHKHFENHSR